MQKQGSSPSAGMRLPHAHSNPAALVGQPQSQPALLGAGPVTEGITAVTAGSELGGDTSAIESAVLDGSSADVQMYVNSAGQEITSPANLTGTVTSAASSSEEAQGLALSLQPAMQPVESGSESHKGVQQSDEPVRGIADPNKQLLAKMGRQVPAEVSKQLLQEVGARSHIEGLLQVSMAYDMTCVSSSIAYMVWCTYNGICCVASLSC